MARTGPGGATYVIPVGASGTGASLVDTELPVAAALADATANPTVPAVGTHGMVFNGATWDRQRVANVFKSQVALSVATEATWWTPTAGKKFRLMGGMFTGSVAGDYVVRDNTAGATIAVIPIGVAGTPFFFDLGNGILSATINNVLTIDGPAISTASGTLFGTEE